MKTTVAEVAALLGETPPPGGPAELLGLAGLLEAGPSDISFLANPRYAKAAESTQAGLLLVPKDFECMTQAAAVLKVGNPSLAFASLVQKFMPAPWEPVAGHDPSAHMHPTAVVPASARIGPGVVVHEGAQIGERCVLLANCVVGAFCELGDDVCIHSNVSIRERVKIGNRVIIHSGAVIGSDGFGYEFKEGRHAKIPQLGTVIIEDDVEIGANTTIDRARFGRTWIREGTKIDNLVQIAHNVVVGRHCIIVSQVGIAGSSVLGDYVTLGGQVGVAGHLHIGDRAMVGAQSGISKDIPAGEVWFGYPATRMTEAKRTVAAVKRLGGLFERVRRLEKGQKSGGDACE